MFPSRCKFDRAATTDASTSSCSCINVSPVSTAASLDEPDENADQEGHPDKSRSHQLKDKLGLKSLNRAIDSGITSLIL